MVIPTPDSGILKRVYANLVGGGRFVSLDVPDKVLKRLYTYGSLKDTDRGVERDEPAGADEVGVGALQNSAVRSRNDHWCPSPTSHTFKKIV